MIRAGKLISFFSFWEQSVDNNGKYLNLKLINQKIILEIFINNYLRIPLYMNIILLTNKKKHLKIKIKKMMFKLFNRFNYDKNLLEGALYLQHSFVNLENLT